VRLTNPEVTIIGGGLAGCEAAWQLAERGVPVRIYEMRPSVSGPAHHTDALAELVCSNSFKSDDPETAPGMLKRELKALGSLLVAVARETAVPAGAALAVDRTAFARTVTALVTSHPLISVMREESTTIPAQGPVIVATGPLTSRGLERALESIVGTERLAFYDAAAPIIDGASIDHTLAFSASRYDKGSGADYVNCPMSKEEYEHFIAELTAAQRVNAQEFESADLFQACQPIEEIARKGQDAVRFGAMKPVGLIDPHSGTRPWAVVQLRAENRSMTAYNMVGFQTNLTWPEQERVFRLIPGLGDAEFLRFGVMHRNTFIDAPRLLTPGLSLRTDRRIRIAGQLCGTEGYLEAVGTGLLAAFDILSELAGPPAAHLPAETVLGALIAYATDPSTRNYQPMHVNVGLLPPLDPPVRSKRARYAAHSARAAQALDAWVREAPIRPLATWGPPKRTGSPS